MSLTLQPSSVPAAEEDAGDAEQDAAADARQGPVKSAGAGLRSDATCCLSSEQQRHPSSFSTTDIMF